MEERLIFLVFARETGFLGDTSCRYGYYQLLTPKVFNLVPCDYRLYMEEVIDSIFHKVQRENSNKIKDITIVFDLPKIFDRFQIGVLDRVEVEFDEEKEFGSYPIKGVCRKRPFSKKERKYFREVFEEKQMQERKLHRELKSTKSKQGTD